MSLTLSAFQEKREYLDETIRRRFFVVPAFEIYGGYAGLYDIGPPGCALRSNIIAQWRKHFIINDSMFELFSPALTPEPVLKASGHVDKFSDVMIRDENTATAYRADQLIEAEAERQLETETSEERKELLKKIIIDCEAMSLDEMENTIKNVLNVTHIEGKPVKWSSPYEFNLMFGTSIGPTGTVKAYLRPETAQGIFVNFKRFYNYNGGQLPFAVAQIGSSYRNEIAPRAGLLRVREFEQAEIEHFMMPEDIHKQLYPEEKYAAHPKFFLVKDTVVPLWSGDAQDSLQGTVTMSIGEAIETGLVGHETHGYFIGRTFQFLVSIGIKPECIRFRQHTKKQLAHYAKDCWDAEVLTSYGWVECVGIADRSAHDLTCHTNASGQNLTANITVSGKAQTVRSIVPRKVSKQEKAAGVEAPFENLGEKKRDAIKALAMMPASEVECAIALMAADKPFTVGEFTITKDMVEVNEKKVKTNSFDFCPCVIEPSFGIGRILSCLLEHTFDLEKDVEVKGEGDRTYDRYTFAFPANVAPIKVGVLPVITKGDLTQLAQEIGVKLSNVGIAHQLDCSAAKIGKRYARLDELGVPFCITVDQDTVSSGVVTIRDRDSRKQISNIPIDEAVEIIRKLSNDQLDQKKVFE